jgi:hydroxymethylglutaryl-CoA reductase (NADPH)
MDLRSFPSGSTPKQRVDERRMRIEQEFDVSLDALQPREEVIGFADEKNCEQMFGVVPVPVGYAGPLSVCFSDGTTAMISLPLATTEGALVASVNRGCKALLQSGVQITKCVHHGTTRSIAFRSEKKTMSDLHLFIDAHHEVWKAHGEATSGHLTILHHAIDIKDDHLFLTIHGDTGEAMGMNMITIAAQAIAEFVASSVDGCECVTIAGNVDSDKKPSKRTHQHGRGFEVHASAEIDEEIIASVLRTTAEKMVNTAQAKLTHGSALAGALGTNLHAANIIAALYIALGQDPAHVVEGSLADTSLERTETGVRLNVRLPAILVGVRGGGTSLPAQIQCRHLFLKPEVDLPKREQLAQSIAAAVLAGELSLLAAQSSHSLAKAHQKMGR